MTKTKEYIVCLKDSLDFWSINFLTTLLASIRTTDTVTPVQSRHTLKRTPVQGGLKFLPQSIH